MLWRISSIFWHLFPGNSDEALCDPLGRFADDLLPDVRPLEQEVVAPVVEGDQLLVDRFGLTVDLLWRKKINEGRSKNKVCKFN